MDTLAAFVLTSLAIEITPGPNMAYLALLSLAQGRSAGLAAVGGVALGLLVLGLAVGLGLGTLIAESAWLYEVMRWGGVAFLVYLAWDAYRESRKPLVPVETAGQLASYFRRGLVTNLLNPKAALFYVAVLPNFVRAEGPQWPQSLLLTGIYVAIATAVHAMIALGAGLAQPLLTSEKVRRLTGVVAALLLCGIAAWLAYATRRAAV